MEYTHKCQKTIQFQGVICFLAQYFVTLISLKWFACYKNGLENEMLAPVIGLADQIGLIGLFKLTLEKSSIVLFHRRTILTANFMLITWSFCSKHKNWVRCDCKKTIVASGATQKLVLLNRWIDTAINRPPAVNQPCDSSTRARWIVLDPIEIIL
jgi:hypothetical protein